MIARVVLSSLIGAFLSAVLWSEPAWSCPDGIDDIDTGSNGGVYGAGGTSANEGCGDGDSEGPAPADAPDDIEVVTYFVCDTHSTLGCHDYQLCPDGTPRERTEYWSDGSFLSASEDCPGDGEDDDRDPTPDEVASEFKKVPLPASTIVVQPPDGETLVNLETIFSTTAEAFDAPLTILDHQVVLHITPSKFTWHHGDGTSQSTTWPGAKWTDGANPAQLVHHIYKATATGLTVSVDTTWTATWTLDGRNMGAVPGVVTKTGGTNSLDVLEARPVLTR